MTDPGTAAHLHATDAAADSCPICFPGESDDPGQPCTGCGVTLFGYDPPRCEWCVHADEARADGRERTLAALREWLPQYVATIIHGRTANGQPIYASGPVAFPDALVDTFALMSTPDDELLERRR